MTFPSPSRASSRGLALILVLAFIVLIAGLLVAYFVIATRAVQSAASYKDTVAAQQLAETAVNVVMGQIADGTHTTKEGAPDEGVVWTSQPGLIRTYGTDGLPYRFYKLYSSADMVVQQFDKGYWSPEENVTNEVPDNWYERSGIFADLNAPALLPLDTGAGSIGGNPPDGGILVNGTWHYANYPILDPAAQASTPGNRDGVEGFAINATRLSSAPRSPPPPGYNPTLATDLHRSPNPAPMPVRWLYVLRDGRLTAPERWIRGTGGAEEMHWTPGSPSAPTRDNPIVGRIAFWADDETCKLNVNTASEGVYWDRPSGNGGGGGVFDEKTFAGGIPRGNEWQRTPGHPAMTCLSPVFGMLPDYRPPLTANYTRADYKKFSAYYDLVPRVEKGGTEAGTLSNSKGSTPGGIAPDQDRLFASPDEVFFTPKKAVPRERTNSRDLKDPIPRSFIEKTKFFITASNRAPETNMFNRPRLSLWPVQQEIDPNHGHAGCPDRPRTSQDDLFAACSTLNKLPYFFQRYSVYMTGAVNDSGAHPADPFGQQGDLQPPSSQRTDLDWKIERNQQLYRYLQDLTDRPVPGVAGRAKFTDKLGADRDQLLTSMVDFLRTANDLKPPNLMGSYAYSPPHESGEGMLHLGLGQVVPLVPPAGTPGEGTKGTGRFPTITEAAFVLFRTGQNLGAMLVLQPFAPTAGPPTWVPLVRVCVRGLDQFLIDGRTLDMPAVATNLYAPASMCPHTTQAFNCSFAMYTFQAGGGSVQNKTAGTANEEKNYPFCSRAILPVPAGNAELNFSGGKITVEMHTGYYGKPGSALIAPPADTLVQTLQFDFPQTVLPVPPVPSRNVQTADQRMAAGRPIYGSEVVRSIQVDPKGPTGGDLRLLSALPGVPANYFHPHPDYFSKKLAAHSLRSYGDYVAEAKDSVQLLAGITSPFAVSANGLRGALLPGSTRQGDWDSGVGSHPEGGQYPRPDEGNDRTADGGYYAQTYSPETGTTWSPMRQLSSPVVFGSLPIGVNPKAPKPWRTLLFCANPAAGRYHPGWQQPRDHYLLDLFQMPIVEPYAISEPLSTAGKVNLNSQIAPFTYIRRDTALRGALRATKIAATAEGTTRRLGIDADETLKGFDRRFADRGGCFKTASELCEMFLVPESARLSDMQDGDPDVWWWKKYRGTGDNLREGPYGHLYSRVTARSNTFTVHYRVQVLGHNATAHPDVWIDGTDPILSEVRGSSLIERYVDSDDLRLRDFATDRKVTIDDCYKFRVLRVQRFGR